uniref:Aldehyde oxidase 5 n=1 Tax=Cyprinus carpio TaxID=7962 RepID=A0A8C1UXM3_CYPCA
MSSLSVNSELVFYITGKKLSQNLSNDGQLIFLFLLSTNTEHQNLNILLSFFLGNLCRCTGYRWIIDGFKTFCDISGELFRMDNVLPLDPTQDLIFPPELLIIGKQKTEQVFFQGEKVRWISPADLKDLIKLKAEYPNAPLLVGNTTIMNLKRTVHPLVIYGGSVNLRAGCSLSILNDVLLRGIEKLGPEKSKVYQALVQTLQCLVGKQIRNIANPKYDLSSILTAAECTLHIVSNGNASIFGLYLYIISYNILIVIFKLLVEGTQLLEEEISVPPTAPGGREEYHKSLVLRFFFKLYTQVLLELQQKEVGMHDMPFEYLRTLKPFKNEVPQGNNSFQLVPETQSSSGPVGRPNVHQAALQQTTGEAVYYDDLPAVKGELFVSVVTSTMVHAKIISIDAPVALATSGVITFISAKDVPGQNRRLWFNNPEELFAEKEVICVGQIIGTIVAETREQAKRVAEQVDIQTVFFTIEVFRKLERGNEEEGFEKADHILKGELYMGGQEHFYMETQGLIAIPKGEAGEMEPYVASQHAAFTQEVVGITLGIDSNKITCHVKRLGGGFGVKVMKIGSLSAITATATYKTSRAVRCVLERGDDMLFTSGSNGGCTLDESSFIVEKALLHMDNGYKIPNLPFHGFGGPQELTNIESVLHEVAARCGLPAHLVRDINMYKDEKCYTHHKQLFSPHDMVQCWNECLEKSDYTHRCLSIEQFNAHNHWKKRGISTIPLKFRIGFSKGFYNQVGKNL